ncbi:MAG: HAD-IA family hydrolase [Bacilli bacterium]|nr:HAD-IA family hydrolase [Bacilli bacterium]
MKKILFDADGTIYDSGRGIKSCANKTLAYFGYPEKPFEELDFFVGPPLKTGFLKCGLTEEEAQQAIEVYRMFYNQGGKYDAIIYPGMLEVIKTLYKDNLLYIATFKKEELARDIAHHFNLDIYFQDIYGGIGNEKPDKTSLIKRVLDNTPYQEETYMIGDTNLDIIGGKNNHLKTIAVSYGYGDLDKIKESQPDHLVKTPKELLDILK